jgi:predicted acylesterase/phospholipase RssA
MRISLICSIVLLVSLAAWTQSADTSKCYGLALQGGGDKAAYQVGAIQGLIENLPADQIQYDVVTGVGIGAINAAVIAAHGKGDEIAALAELTTMWKNLKEKDVYKNWSWGGPVRGLLFEASLYDSRPFRSFISKNVKAPVRKLQVSATDASTGSIMTWNETATLDTLHLAIDASAAYPGFFQPVEDLDGHTYYDGGTSQSINIAGAIRQCKALGYAESDIVIDVVLNSAATIKEKDTSKYTSIPMLIRYLEIRLYYDTMDLFERAKLAFGAVNFRYAVAPTQKLEPGKLPFSFNSKQIARMMAVGLADAKDAINIGEGVSVEDLIEYTDEKNAHDFDGDYHDYLEDKYIERRSR